LKEDHLDPGSDNLRDHGTAHAAAQGELQERGYDGLVDHRGGRPRRKRIPMKTIEALCKLKREKYADFSVQHFWEKATEEHGIAISYTWARLALQAAGLVEKSPGRGRYRRKRERRAMRGCWFTSMAPRISGLRGCRCGT